MQSSNSDAQPILTTAAPKPTESPSGSGIDTATALLESFASIPSLSKGWAFPTVDGSTHSTRVTIQLSQRNLPANAQRKYLTSFLLSEATLELSENGAVDTCLPVDLRDASLFSPSPSGNRMFIVRPGTNTNNGGGEKSAAVLEFWDRSRALREIHVPLSFHGSVYNDGWFGIGAAWSPDEKFIAYIAECPVAVKTPEFGGRIGPSNSDTTTNTTTTTTEKESKPACGPKTWRGLGEFQEDWGELNTGKRPPTLFVLDTTTGEVEAVQGLPENASVGQPQWSPDGSSLLFVGWPHTSPNFPNFPQRLGIVYCFNRPCGVHAVRWPQPKERGGPESSAAVHLTSSVSSAFSPRFSPDGKTLVILSQEAAVESGVHSGTPALLSLPWSNDVGTKGGRTTTTPTTPPPPPIRRVVDVVWRPETESSFPGLYCSVLPEQPFLYTTTTTTTTAAQPQPSLLITTVQWKSNMAVVAIDPSTGTVTRVTPDNGASWSLLAINKEWLVVTESHLGQPCKIYTTHVVGERALSTPDQWSWSLITLPDTEQVPDDVAAVLAQLETNIVQLTPTIGPTDTPFEAIIVKRKDLQGPLPTVVSPHGGPHSAYPAQYFMATSFLAACGYTVVLVNYRGSTGFGEASIQSLPGHIGTNDVADCMEALAAAVAAGVADPDRIAAVGGSHGGFLSSHLIGQHPEAFKACVLRNPVCNIAQMIYLTDIPDWCYIEAWGSEKGRERAGSNPTPEDLQRFAHVSPVRWASQVTAPILMMVGACDRRVPQDDGKRYLDAVRKESGNGVETRLIVFPQDTHGLDKPQTEFEQWVTAVWWLNRFL